MTISIFGHISERLESQRGRHLGPWGYADYTMMAHRAAGGTCKQRAAVSAPDISKKLPRPLICPLWGHSWAEILFLFSYFFALSVLNPAPCSVSRWFNSRDNANLALFVCMLLLCDSAARRSGDGRARVRPRLGGALTYLFG